MSYFKQNSVTLDLRNLLIHFPDVSLQLRKANRNYNCDMLELRAVLPPNQQVVVEVWTNAEMETTTGTAEAPPAITGEEALLVTPMVKLEKD